MDIVLVRPSRFLATIVKQCANVLTDECYIYVQPMELYIYTVLWKGSLASASYLVMSA